MKSVFLKLKILSLFTFLITPPLYAQDDFSAIVEKMEPSIVSIYTYSRDERIIGQGNGFFIGPEGQVITTRNVLEGVDHADVKIRDGALYPVRRALAEDREANLIHVSVDMPPKAVHPPAVNSTLPQVGERIVAIRSPWGSGHRAASGTVSAIREIPAFGKVIETVIRLGSEFNGSPVVNRRGEVIGVITSLDGQWMDILPIERGLKMAPGQGKTLSEWEAGRVDSGERLYSIGLTQLRRSAYEKAILSFKKALEKNPRYANARFQIGYCQAQLGRYAEAVEAYKDVIQVNPEFAMAHFFLGLAFLDLRDRESARKEYQILKGLDQGYANDLRGLMD